MNDIRMIPFEAYRIDVSQVKDPENTRLRVAFENGKKLHFSIANSLELYLVPEDPFTAMSADEKDLLKILSDVFYNERIDRSVGRRTLDWIGDRLNPGSTSSYIGWRRSDVGMRLSVRLFAGTQNRPSELAVGRDLFVDLSVRQEDPYGSVSARIPWGPVAEVSSYTPKPAPPFRVTSFL